MIKKLVQDGADIHERDDYALGVAALNGHLDVVKYLVQNGADIHARDDYMLRNVIHSGIVDYLKSIVRKEKIEDLNVS